MGQTTNYGEGYSLKGRPNPFLCYLAKDDPKRTVNRLGITIRRTAYPLIKKLSGPMTGVSGVFVRKESLPPGPKIFAVTHTYSREDIAWGISLAGEQSYLITNAYQELLYTSDGWALWAAGVILVNRYRKRSRQACIQKAERVLSLGGNVMIFPEGVWNMSENLLVRKLYPGVYRIASAANVPVIPISTMVYDGVCYVSRGKALYFDKFDQTESLKILRDSLASLKWEIMERHGRTTRNELLRGESPSEYWKSHLEAYIRQQKIYEREAEENAHYKDEVEVAQQEIAEAYRRLRLSPRTAFLFRAK